MERLQLATSHKRIGIDGIVAGFDIDRDDFADITGCFNLRVETALFIQAHIVLISVFAIETIIGT